MKLHHYNEAYAWMVRREKFADGTPPPKPERTFADKLRTLKEVSKGISPESRLRLLDYFIQEALKKNQITKDQASGIYDQLQQDKDKIRDQIDAYERENFSEGSKDEQRKIADDEYYASLQKIIERDPGAKKFFDPDDITYPAMDKSGNYNYKGIQVQIDDIDKFKKYAEKRGLDQILSPESTFEEKIKKGQYPVGIFERPVETGTEPMDLKKMQTILHEARHKIMMKPEFQKIMDKYFLKEETFVRYLDKEFFPELDAYLPDFEYPEKADKIYKKAVEEYKDKFTKEDKGFINKLKSFFADGGRAGFANGLSVQTLNPAFPTKDPTSTDFKPLDVPGAIIPPLALGATAKRIKDTFFSKDKGEDKKEVVPSDDKGSNIEPPKGPKFELKDVLTESIFESMRDPENRNKVKSILNEQKNFFNKKNVDRKTTEKFIKSVENKAITLPGQQNYKQPVFNKDYLNLFKDYVDKNHGGNLTKAIDELGINVGRRTIQRRFQETNMGTFTGAEAQALLDVEPGTSTYTEVMETMKSNPKNIFSNINLKIKKGDLSKNSYVESIDLANLLGIDGTNPEQRNAFLKRLRKLDIRTKAGTQGGKAKKYHIGDVLDELAFYTKNERQALAGDGVNYQKLRQKREFDKGLSTVNSALRRNIVSRLDKTDIAIPKISLAEDMGHAESVEVVEKYPNLFKGSNVKSLQTLVRQDPIINQSILVDQGYHSQNDAIYKQFKNKKINIAEANNLLKLNNERIKRIIRNEARTNSFFKDQENRIPLLQINKDGIVNADMSTVDSFYIYGNINEINPKANKVSDLSEKQLNAFLKNLKNQWTDGAAKFITSLKDKQGNRIYSNEDIEEFRDILELPTEKTGTTKYKFEKGGPVYGKYARQIAGLS